MHYDDGCRTNIAHTSHFNSTSVARNDPVTAVSMQRRKTASGTKFDVRWRKGDRHHCKSFSIAAEARAFQDAKLHELRAEAGPFIYMGNLEGKNDPRAAQQALREVMSRPLEGGVGLTLRILSAPLAADVRASSFVDDLDHPTVMTVLTNAAHSLEKQADAALAEINLHWIGPYLRTDEPPLPSVIRDILGS